MDYLIYYFRSIIIFLIFMNFVSILIPNKSYKSYLDFVLGLILIGLVISPILKILKIDNIDVNNFISANMQYSGSTNEVSLAQSSYNLDTYNSTEDYTIALYENQVATTISNQIEKEFLVTPTDVYVEIDNKDLSTILEITMTIPNSSIYIQPVNIGSEENGEYVENEDIKNIKNSISQAYNLSVDNININIGN